eukprot:g17091.t1
MSVTYKAKKEGIPGVRKVVWSPSALNKLALWTLFALAMEKRKTNSNKQESHESTRERCWFNCIASASHKREVEEQGCSNFFGFCLLWKTLRNWGDAPSMLAEVMGYPKKKSWGVLQTHAEYYEMLQMHKEVKSVRCC